MSRPSWSNAYEEEERDTEQMLSKRFGPDVPLMGWSESRIDPLGLKHAREGGMAYGPGAGWWQTVPVIWRLVLILIVLAFLVGLFFLMRSLATGRIAHELYRPHSPIARPRSYDPDDPASGRTGSSGAL